MTSEVHLFLGGNGRVSRVMMNAKLTHARESKIIVPTVFRDDYMNSSVSSLIEMSLRL